MEAIYGGGEYAISPKYAKFAIKDYRWHTWSEKRRRDYVESFRRYFPNLSDGYNKPVKAGRKSNFVSRKRHNSEMVIDRVEEETKCFEKETGAASIDENGIKRSCKIEKHVIVDCSEIGHSVEKKEKNHTRTDITDDSSTVSRIGDPR